MGQTLPARRRSRRPRRAIVAAAALAAASAVAPTWAANPTLYWDGGSTALAGNGDGVSQGGSGTWDNTTANWDYGSGTGHGRWIGGDDAVFAGTAGTVTVGDTIFANAVTVNAANYTFAGGAGTLNIGTGGLTANATTGTTTLASGLTVGLAGNQTWTAAGNVFGDSLSIGSTVSTGTSTLTLAGGTPVGIYGQITGSGGLTVANFSTTIDANNTYTGTTTVNANATLTVDAVGTGADTATGPIANAGYLEFLPGGSALSVASNITSTAGGSNLDVAANGNGTGSVQLTGTNAVGGTLAVSGATLAIGSHTTLTGAVQLGYGQATLDLGGTAQTVANLSATNDTSTTTAKVTNGSLSIAAATTVFSYAPSNSAGTSSLDLSGLTSFTFAPTTSSGTYSYFDVAVGRGGAANTTVTLAAANTISASFVDVGGHYDPTVDGGTGSASGPGGTGTLYLGPSTAIHTGGLYVGGYQTSGGVVQFGPAAGANPTLTLRSIAGGAVQNLYVAQVQSGTVSQASVFDVSAGTLTAAVYNLTVGQVNTATPPPSVAGTFAMGAGTLNVANLFVGSCPQTNVGATTQTAAVNQSGGAVLATSVEFAALDNGASPNLKTVGTYTLGTAGTPAVLSAAFVELGTYAAAATSAQTVAFVNGTVTNYDDAANGFGGKGTSLGGAGDVADLTLAGQAGGGAAGDYRTLQINLVGTTPHNLLAEAGHKVTEATTARIDGPGSLTVSGPGRVVLAGTNAYTGGTSVTNGTLELTATGTLAGPLTTSGSGSVTFDAGTGILVRSVGAVTVGGSGTVSVAAATAGRTAVVATSLSLTATGQFDLSNNDLRLTGTTLQATTALAATGFAGGAWNGPGGLVSTTAAADARHLTAVGVIANQTGSGSTLYPTFDGRGAAATDVLVRYTYYGDADLSGTVTAADYLRVDAGFVGHLTGWANGDFNYDGVVDGSDYTLMDNAFNQQTGPVGGPAAMVAMAGAELAVGTAAVLEPAVVGLLAVAGVSLLGGRRRRR